MYKGKRKRMEEEALAGKEQVPIPLFFATVFNAQWAAFSA
jgi:hypothetical protein